MPVTCETYSSANFFMFALLACLCVAVFVIIAGSAHYPVVSHPFIKALVVCRLGK